MRLQTRARNGIIENSLSNGTLLWWSVVLFDGFLSLVLNSFEPAGNNTSMMK
jgi:hypothetical protein